MSDSGKEFPLRLPSAGYGALCGIALAALLIVQLQQGLGLSGLLVLGMGILGIVTRLRITPLLFLILLATEVLAQQYLLTGQFAKTVSSLDLLRAAAATAFVMGCFRLQGV